MAPTVNHTPQARDVLPPFDVFVSTPSPRLQSAPHVATYAARFDEVLAGAGSSASHDHMIAARIRSTSGISQSIPYAIGHNEDDTNSVEDDRLICRLPRDFEA